MRGKKRKLNIYHVSRFPPVKGKKKCKLGFSPPFENVFLIFLFSILGLQHSRKDRLRDPNTRRNTEAPFPEHSEGPAFTRREESHGVQCPDIGLHLRAAETRGAECKRNCKGVGSTVYL